MLQITSFQLSSTKICETCLNRVLTTFLLVQQSRCLKSRITNCLDHMMKSLNAIQEPQDNVFIEIASNIVMPKYDEDIFEKVNENDDEIPIDILEDEFRIEESESENDKDIRNKKTELTNETDLDEIDIVPRIFREKNHRHYLGKKYKLELAKTYSKAQVCNGYDKNTANINEFLTFHNKNNKSNNIVDEFRCLICNKKFISNYFLKTHVKKHLNEKQRCNECAKIFKSKFCLLEHIKKEHNSNSGYKVSCAHCGRNFKNDSKLRKHEKIHLDRTCFLCGKKFINDNFYNSHMQKHLIKSDITKKGRLLNCSLCEKECENKNDLSLHVNKVHLQIKPFPCDMCEKQCYTAQDLACHKKIHNLPSHECCQFCEKTLKNRRHFVVHLRKHLRTKPFKCHVCDLDFYCKSKNISHMIKSHGGKFPCRLCKNVFPSKEKLKFHVNIGHGIYY